MVEHRVGGAALPVLVTKPLSHQAGGRSGAEVAVCFGARTWGWGEACVTSSEPAWLSDNTLTRCLPSLLCS